MTSFLERVCIIGSGNWGSAICRIIGHNVRRYPNVFHEKVNMWVFEETVEGRLLTDWINAVHVNPKYLPGITLPENIVAVPDLVASARDASLLVFVVPHQFVKRTCQTLKGHIAPNARAISLIKGVDASASGLTLISDLIAAELGLDVSVLMGANIANEVAQEQFCEATIGYRRAQNGNMFRLLFDTKDFKINCIDDVEGVELCGALKNVVAVAAGTVDGLGMGENTKAAVIRIGLVEMRKFGELFHSIRASSGLQAASAALPTLSHSASGREARPRWETYFESCGVADLITTCFAGRNRKLSEAHVKTGKSFEELEAELLNGQKLQGPLTAKEVYQILLQRGQAKEFPLFTSVYQICYEDLDPRLFLDHLSSWSTGHLNASPSPSLSGSLL